MASSPRQFLLKFSVPDSKKLVVLDCGNKIYLTDFERPTTQTPSNFVTKLRKHLKTRRLSLIKQIKNDRILVLNFSDGQFYLVLEFFSAGNILLLDEEQKILSLQRMVSDKGDNDRYAVNETYKMFDKNLFTELLEDKLQTFSADQVRTWIQLHREAIHKKAQDPSLSKKKKQVYSLHKLLFVNSSHLPSEMILRNLHDVGVVGNQSCLEFEDKDLESVVEALKNSDNEYRNLVSSLGTEVTGIIVSKKNPAFEPSDDNKDLEYLYDEFHPFKPYKENLELFKFTEIRGYNKTVDTFFSTLDSKKHELRMEQQKHNAKKRLLNAREERDKQIDNLRIQQEMNSKKGDAIIYHADLVSECIASVQTLLDQQMDWANIESLIKLEQSRGNSVAKTIKLPLNLTENKIGLKLPDTDSMYDPADIDSELDSETSSESETESESESESGSDSEDETPPKRMSKKAKSKEIPTLSVWIDLLLSPFANARTYFESKKQAESKQEKVEKNTDMALRNAQKKIEQDLAKNLKNENETLRQVRPKYWFEKFFWFVSSEGYLCIAGRDDAQVDMVYYRHFSDNDFFVSSDIEGSLKVVVKNPYRGEALPPYTLMQAGMFAMSASAAWNGKITTSPWFLAGNDVTKLDFDGSLVPSGTFNYKGKKEFLPPTQLVMGLGFYFLGDDDTTKKYGETRITRQNESGLKVVMDNTKQDFEKLALSLGRDKEEENEREQKEEENEKEEQKEEEEDMNSGSLALEIENVSQTTSSISLDEPHKLTRGKRSKMKRAAKKYADQDEDERKLRMEMLGTLKQLEEIKKKRQENADQDKQQAQQQQNDKLKQTRKAKQEQREYLKYMREEVNEDESSMVNYLDILDSFIAKPQPSDKLVAIVPVFAPWYSLNKFKYKVKIQPGMAKKGKSINETLHYFTTRKLDQSRTDMDVDWPDERALVSEIKPNDVMGSFTVNKLKVVLPTEKGKETKGKGVKKKGKK